MNLYRWDLGSSAWNSSLTFVPAVHRAMIQTKLKRQIDAGLRKWYKSSTATITVSIRKPDMAVILHSNRAQAKPLDRSFDGTCDLCRERY